MQSFFTYLKKQIEDQMNWFKDVFPVANATENMIEILLDVFLNLDPGLEFCIQAGIKQQSDQLAYLVHVKEAFNDTLTHLDTVMFVANSDTKSQARMRELSKVIYAPLKPVLDKQYQTMESMKLLSELSDSTSKGQLISEENLVSSNLPKSESIFLRISALASKMGQIKKENISDNK